MTRAARAPHVLLAGGGSGGSATPVLAVAQSIRERCSGVKFLYVGTAGGPERALAEEEKIPFVSVQAGKLRRYWDRQNLTDPARVLLGLAQAYRLARRFEPDVVFAAGGFASVPPVAAARLAGARVAIHQQDVLPGLANRLLAPLAQRVTVALPGTAARFPTARPLVTGNPVRREVLQADPRLAREALGLTEKLPLVVATGGGTGALGLNRLLATTAEHLVDYCQVVHLTGAGRQVASAFESPRYRQIAFLTREMPHLLAAATLVVSRAGMGTLSELAALRKAALILPLPRSHQWANARAFHGLGAIELLEQEAVSGEVLARHILALLNDAPRRNALGDRLGQSMPSDAADRVAEAVLRLI